MESRCSYIWARVSRCLGVERIACDVIDVIDVSDVSDVIEVIYVIYVSDVIDVSGCRVSHLRDQLGVGLPTPGIVPGRHGVHSEQEETFFGTEM